MEAQHASQRTQGMQRGMEMRHHMCSAGQDAIQASGFGQASALQSSMQASLVAPFMSACTMAHAQHTSTAALAEVLDAVRLPHLSIATFTTLLPILPWLRDADPTYVPRLLRVAAQQSHQQQRNCVSGFGSLTQSDCGSLSSLHWDQTCMQAWVGCCQLHGLSTHRSVEVRCPGT